MRFKLSSKCLTLPDDCVYWNDSSVSPATLVWIRRPEAPPIGPPLPPPLPVEPPSIKVAWRTYCSMPLKRPKRSSQRESSFDTSYLACLCHLPIGSQSGRSRSVIRLDVLVEPVGRPS